MRKFTSAVLTPVVVLAMTVTFMLFSGADIAVAADKRALPARAISPGSTAHRRTALVIGNGRYKISPLQNPVNDARAMGSLLKSIGFDVVIALDADLRTMQDAILKFADKLSNGGAGLFYYAGHGVQVRGVNYLIPIDHHIKSESSVRFESISLDAVLEQMGQPRPNRTNIVILDACRNNPFANRFSGSGAGLALVDAPTDFLVSYATAPGSVAMDGDDNAKNGVYTSALLKALRVPNLRVEDVFKRVRAEVSFKTRRQQIPWEASSLVRNFVLNKPVPKTVQSAGLDEKQVERIVKKVENNAAVEIAFWNAIKDSKFEADYRAYLEAFPNGRFAPLARLRARRYTGREPSPAGEPPPRVPAVAAKTVAPPASHADRSGAVEKAPVRKPKSVVAAKPIAPKPPPKTAASKAKLGTQVAVGVFPEQTKHGYVASKGEFRDCASCPSMVVVPPGHFTMGDAKGDSTERPAHRVNIKSRFAMGKYEVTLGQWMACVADGGCKYRPKLKRANDNAPVRNLSWIDALEYTRWLTRKTGQHYRLPTESEWEYAARAGTTTRYWWGDRAESSHANCANCGGAYNRKHPSDVGLYKPNPFGLYDMNGGALEWVADCWRDSYASAPTDGSAHNAAGCSQRVLRGGSWRSKESDIRSSIRLFYDASVRYYTNGFRVARALP